MPRKPKPKPAAEPTRRRWPEVDALFVATIRDAAAWMVEHGCPDPGLASLVRVAASDLERFYAADMVAPRLPSEVAAAEEADRAFLARTAMIRETMEVSR